MGGDNKGGGAGGGQQGSAMAGAEADDRAVSNILYIPRLASLLQPFI